MARLLMSTFRLMPPVLRRLAVRAGTPSYTVGAVVVLRRPDGRVLLVDQRHTGAWALPGGLLRHGEGPDQGLVREVAEEVGVQLDGTSLPAPVAAVDARHRRVDLVYVVECPDGAGARAADTDEVRRVGWFDLAELPRVTEPTADIVRLVRAG